MWASFLAPPNPLQIDPKHKYHSSATASSQLPGVAARHLPGVWGTEGLHPLTPLLFHLLLLQLPSCTCRPLTCSHLLLNIGNEQTSRQLKAEGRKGNKVEGSRREVPR